jgi:hypothetical protein
MFFFFGNAPLLLCIFLLGHIGLESTVLFVVPLEMMLITSCLHPSFYLVISLSRILEYRLRNHTGQIGVSVDPHEDSIDFASSLQYNIHGPSVLKFYPLYSYIIQLGFT